MSKFEIYCVTDKPIKLIKNKNYNLCAAKNGIFPNSYLIPNTGDNIENKEKYYSELTFHYWFWKNKLRINSDHWIGFCQKRRYWIKNGFDNKKINLKNLNEYILEEPDKSWENFESIICKSIYVNKVKKMKLIKRGWKSLIKDPSIFFDIKKQTIKLHFDMHHGHGNLEKAIDLLDINDREDFREYVNTKNNFNPHIMFISKPYIINKWFNSLFPWLTRCEKIFGFEELGGKYDTKRLYAFLAERYLSFWFKKYTKYKEQSWVLVNI